MIKKKRGRPAIHGERKQPVNFRLTAELRQYLSYQESQSEHIEIVLRNTKEFRAWRKRTRKEKV